MQKDLFEHYEEQLEELKAVLKQFEIDNPDTDLDTYEILGKLQKAVEQIGYTFEYYLDAVPYALRPIGVKLSEVEGYEDCEDSDDETSQL